jgi:proline iminopeptidase
MASFPSSSPARGSGERYAAIEPFATGLLEVDDGQRLFWETCGNPEGVPALVLHGGPGSGCGPGLRRFFDPMAYRVVLFDQRGCGRSVPPAGDPAVSLDTNTTEHQLADIERLREHLGIERWLLFGGSWGCVLGLAYAERFPERVSAIVMMGIATGRRVEVDLLTRGVRILFPDAWAAFTADLTPEERDGEIAAAYARRLASPDPGVRDAAARAWCAWEDAIAPPPPDERYQDPAFRLQFARLVTHYWSNDHFLAPDQVLRDAGRLAGIPGVLVQGVLDLNNLVGTPWLLREAWPDAELQLIDEGSHETRSGGMVEALIRATDRFRGA